MSLSTYCGKRLMGPCLGRRMCVFSFCVETFVKWPRVLATMLEAYKERDAATALLDRSGNGASSLCCSAGLCCGMGGTRLCADFHHLRF